MTLLFSQHQLAQVQVNVLQVCRGIGPDHVGRRRPVTQTLRRVAASFSFWQTREWTMK
jgi:hypothetical protein